MGIKDKVVNWLMGDTINTKIHQQINVLKYEVPGKEYNLPRYLTFKQREYEVWAGGNPIDLLKFYGTYTIVPGETESASRQLFWEWVKGINNVPKMHYPAPDIIMNTMKSLIFTDDLDIHVVKLNDNGEEDENLSNELTETLMEILEDNEHNEKYQSSVMLETYSGSVAYRIVFNNEISDYPIFMPYPAERFELRTELGKIFEIIFKDTYKNKDKTYLLKSHYGKGYIKHKLWLCDSSGDPKKEVDISTLEETKDFNDIIITLDGKKPLSVMLATFKKNRTQTTYYSGTEYGGSDFEGITDTFHMIDELYSQKNLYIRRARPMITMSQRFLKVDDNGNEIVPKEFEYDTVVVRGDESTTNLNKPERDIPELNLQPYDDSIKEEMKNCWQKIGMSYTSVGMEGVGANQSGAALEMRERPTMIIRANKIKLWDKFLQNTYRVLMIFNSLTEAKETKQEDGTIIYTIDDDMKYDYMVEFPTYNNQTFAERVEEAQKALGIAYDYKRSIEHALRYSQYTQEEKDEILKNMKIEQGIALIGDELAEDITPDEAVAQALETQPIEQNVTQLTEEIDEEDVAQKETSYNGAQIQSAVSIVQEYSMGNLTKDTAIEMLVEFLKVSREVAMKMLKNPPKIDDK